jgi:uncharacterized membrane protein
MSQTPPPYQPPPQAPPPATSGGSGLSPNIAGLLCYLLGILGGIIFVLIEKENREVRFNAFQSLGLGAAYIVGVILFAILGAIVRPLGFVGSLLGLAYLILSIVLMVRAYQGQIMKLPVIGDWAAQQAGL